MSVVTVISKSLFKSKTFWFNVAVVLVAVVDALAVQNVALVTEPWFVALVGFVNVVLRPLTKQPVTLKGGERVEVDATEQGRQL
jgi:hypothetical protein